MIEEAVPSSCLLACFNLLKNDKYDESFQIFRQLECGLVLAFSVRGEIMAAIEEDLSDVCERLRNIN